MVSAILQGFYNHSIVIPWFWVMKSSQVYYHHSKTGMQLASFPGPSRGGGERVWYSPFITHGTVRHAEPANDHYGNATGRYGDPSTCARSVY